VCPDVERRQVSAWAVAALTLGVLAVVLIPFGKGGAGLFAVFCGHAALSEVKHKDRTGRGIAAAGLVLGYFALAWVLIQVVTDNI
jgi:uncharacterized protein DUF4190